jgi:hypothetical protein
MNTSTKAMAAINGIMALLFLISALVQFNDPDPVRWILIYGLASVVSGWGMRGRVSWPGPAVVGAAALVWAATLVPAVVGKVGFGEMFESVQMHDVRVERGREMGGLLIISAWMAVLLIFHRRRQPSTR